jgi:hypothetical protein
MAGREPEGTTAKRTTWVAVWAIVFALVFAGLVASMIALVSSDHLPARFVDVKQTKLERIPGGTRLTLVLRHAPRHGQLHTQVVPPQGDEPLTVEVRLSATGAPAPAPSEDDRRTVLVDLPPTDRVRVVDLRWGRDEAVDVVLEDSPAPEPSPR